MAAPAGCRPRRLERSEWHLLAGDACAAPPSPPSPASRPQPAGFSAQLQALIRGFVEYLGGGRRFTGYSPRCRP